MSETNYGNCQFVGRQGEDVVVMVPRFRMTRDEALVHAAWLVEVAMADDGEFAQVRRTVQSQ